MCYGSQVIRGKTLYEVKYDSQRDYDAIGSILSFQVREVLSMGNGCL